MKNERPLILISNDDGITAPGIGKLVALMKQLGEVVVVAPDSPQSGMGHAITIGNTLRLDKSNIFGDVEAWQCSGTPADCVKIAKHYVLKDRRPNLVVSGINHGSNSSVSILYSGTMSAAIEAALEGLPSIGFSLCDYGLQADFSHIGELVTKIAGQVLDKGLPDGVTLNVNFPAISEEPIKGIKICRQARGKWQEDFDQRVDPVGRPYFWLVGSFVNQDSGPDTDVEALANNYVSIVPSVFDLTAHSFRNEMTTNWKWE